MKDILISWSPCLVRIQPNDVATLIVIDIDHRNKGASQLIRN